MERWVGLFVKVMWVGFFVESEVGGAVVKGLRGSGDEQYFRWLSFWLW